MNASFVSKTWLALLVTAVLVSTSNRVHAQVNFSSGSPYTQNFDSLTTGGAGSWTDNSTINGWYASHSNSSGSFTAYILGTGSGTAGGLYSFGPAAGANRALGSLGSGNAAVGASAYGVRFVNDTANPIENIAVAYTGEQWRNGGSAATKLNFSYVVSASPITSSDATGAGQAWIFDTDLDFTTPVSLGSAGALDGTAAANQAAISNVLSGVTVAPGQEIFFRWLDRDDLGTDAGVALDNLSITFTSNTGGPTPVAITSQPASRTNDFGTTATFTVGATGSSLTYQWYFSNALQNISIGGAVNSTLTLTSVSNENTGGYYVIVANDINSATSHVANLVVNAPIFTNMAYLHSLEDQTTFAPTNTTTVFKIRGQVTSYVNMSTVNNKEFFMQDATGGMEVFRAASSLTIPNNGDYVEVLGTLSSFDGAMEFLPLSDASLTVLSNSATLPTPLTFNFASSNNVPFMESIEGRRVICKNVTLDTGSGGGVYVAATNITMLDSSSVPFILRIDARASAVIGQPIPSGPVDVVGIMEQFDSATPFDTGYEVLLLQPTDVVTSTGGGPTPGNPRITSIVSTASGLVVSGTNGTVSGTYKVLTSPVITGLPGGWITGPTYGFDGAGNFSFTNAVSGSALFIGIQQQP